MASLFVFGSAIAPVGHAGFFFFLRKHLSKRVFSWRRPGDTRRTSDVDASSLDAVRQQEVNSEQLWERGADGEKGGGLHRCNVFFSDTSSAPRNRSAAGGEGWGQECLIRPSREQRSTWTSCMRSRQRLPMKTWHSGSPYRKRLQRERASLAPTTHE